jgi:FkbM family methyltransferase
MAQRYVVTANVPVEIESAEEMSRLDDYEVPYFGTGLEIVDIGANIGTFALWATMRWQLSRIHCFEPHPGTFELLRRNVRELHNVICNNAAVSSSPMPLYSRYPGDSEAALFDHAMLMFETVHQENLIVVPVVNPRDLPRADIVKIDTEGAEFDIVSTMDLTTTSLVLLDYHSTDLREKVLAHLGKNFDLLQERRMSWAPLLNRSRYRQELRNDYFGTLSLIRKDQSRLRRNDFAPYTPAAGLRTLLKQLPQALKSALATKIRR